MINARTTSLVKKVTITAFAIGVAALGATASQAQSRLVRATDQATSIAPQRSAGECWKNCTDADYHFAGTVGRLGLGADPQFPEGSDF